MVAADPALDDTAQAGPGPLLEAVREAAGRQDWVGVLELVADGGEEHESGFEIAFVRTLAHVHLDDLATAKQIVDEIYATAMQVREWADVAAVIHALAGDLNTSIYYGKLGTTLPSDEALSSLLPDSFPTFANVLTTIHERPQLLRAANSMMAGQWEAAEYAIRQHLAFFPEDRDAHLGRAACLFALERPRAVVEALRAARHRLPFDAEIASMLGKALATIGKSEEARACHRWAQAQAPDDPGIHAVPLVERLYSNEQSFRHTVELFQKWGRRFGARDCAPSFAAAAMKPVLTVGYILAGRENTHAAGFIAETLFFRSKERFATVGFGKGALSDGANVVFQKCFDRWQDIEGADPLTVSAMVRAEGVDILVDLAGFVNPGILTAFGSRMAPCQIAWLDVPCGTGLAAMDFLLTDRFVDPDPTGGRRYHETLVNLDLGCAVVDASEALAGPVDMAGRDTSETVFAVDATLQEITPANVERWARILLDRSDAVLLLRDHDFRGGENLADLIGLFGDFGLAHRVDIVSEQTPRVFFAAADVCLLPMPFARPQTVIDALSTGVPVVCPVGAGRHERFAGSVLHHLGFGDRMLAGTEDDYVALALSWADDADARATLRSTCRERLAAAPYLDAEARAVDLEAVLESTYRTIVGGASLVAVGRHG